MVYLGSLAALLLQSFYSIDEFSGVVVPEFTLKTYAELFRAQNMDIILRTVAMAAAVTLGCAVIGFPIAYFAARYAKGPWKAVFYLGVMLPLWSSYLVKVYAWKLILAKEGIIDWAAEGTGTSAILNAVLSIPGDRGQLAVHVVHRDLAGLRLCLAALHDPADAGGAGAGSRPRCWRRAPIWGPRAGRRSAP